MAMPVLPPALIAQLFTLVAQYISGQTDQVRARRRPVVESTKGLDDGILPVGTT
jgi:hypothetical protein